MQLARINQIKGNVEIYASKKSTNILDGSYKSIYRGRSLDFDNLREYIVGDNIKDIDWKASVRSGELLVRQYIAEKKHNILLIFDSCSEMFGSAPSGEEKYKIASLAAGTIAYLAIKNGDFVAGLWQTENLDKYTFLPYRDSLLQIEKIMTFYEDYMSDSEKDYSAKKHDKKSTKTQDSSLNETLEYALKFIPRRSVIFIFTDLQKLKTVDLGIIKKLIISHDILFVNIKDASLTTPAAIDLEENKDLPPFFEKRTELEKLEKNLIEEIYQTAEKNLKRFRISSVTLNDSKTLTPSIIELLERHRYANIR